jgi:hypothetical protein
MELDFGFLNFGAGICTSLADPLPPVRILWFVGNACKPLKKRTAVTSQYFLTLGKARFHKADYCTVHLGRVVHDSATAVLVMMVAIGFRTAFGAYLSECVMAKFWTPSVCVSRIQPLFFMYLRCISMKVDKRLERFEPLSPALMTTISRRKLDCQLVGPIKNC